MNSPELARFNLRQGSALIIVLGCVALLTVLILSFLTMAMREQLSSNAFATEVNTKLLSDTVLNLVMTQIRQGTLSLDANAGTQGNSTVVAWASQPGMIRTYDTTSSPTSYYKLFSSDVLVGSGAYTAKTDANDTPPTDWPSMSSVYVDLNEPSNGAYPIVDGTNLTAYTGTLTPYQGRLTYSGSTPPVEGFSVTPPGSGNTFGTTTNQVAMPVQWLYVLQDGTLVPPTWTDATNKATIPGANTTDKKIIGRVAFWTDDETSKVNINTASEGSFWDVPFADGAGERTLALNIPVHGEYNRVPGHPATVCLSSIFKDIFTPSTSNPDPTNLVFNPIDYAADVTTLQNLFSLSPRMEWGGSKFGSAPNPMNPETTSSPIACPYTYNYNPPSAPSPIDNQASRLYSSIDELLYGLPTASTPPRATNTSITAAAVQRARFFATADSRAPEVTLFNTPKVSLWPITWPWNPSTSPEGSAPVPDVVNSIENNTYFTSTAPPMLQSTEKLLAYCGEVGGWPYYFQRQDAYSTTNDWTSIPRNQDLIAYLQTLTGNSIPGYGGDFKTKYGADRDQILTEIMDFCRSGPDLNNTTVNPSGGTITNYNFAPTGNRSQGIPTAGGSTVVPLQASTTAKVTLSSNTQGAGRYMTINEIALVFYAADRQMPNATTTEPATTMSISPPMAPSTYSSSLIQRHYIHYPGDSTLGAATYGPGPNAGKHNTNLDVNGFFSYFTSGTTAPINTQPYGMQTTKLGMYLVANVVNTAPAYVTSSPYFIIKIVGPNGSGTTTPFAIAGVSPNANGAISTTGIQSLDFPDIASHNMTLVDLNTCSGSWDTELDAFTGCWWTMGIPRNYGANSSKSFTHGPYDARRYPFFADPVPVDPNDVQFRLMARDITVQIWSVDPTSSTMAPLDLVQSIQVPLSQLSGVYPMPCAPCYSDTSTAGTDGTTPVPSSAAPGLAVRYLQNTVPYTEWNSNSYYYPNSTSPWYKGAPGGIGPPDYKHYYFSLTNAPHGGDPITGAAYVGYGDMRNLQLRSQQVNEGGNPSASAPTQGIFNAKDPSWGFELSLLNEPCDTAISMKLDSKNGVQGDLRILGLTTNVPSSTGGWFVPHYALSTMLNASNPSGTNHIAAVSLPPANNVYAGYFQFESRTSIGSSPMTAWSGENTTALPSGMAVPQAPVTLPNVQGLGDFSNGIGDFSDGGMIPKPDDTSYTIRQDDGLQTPFYGGYTGFVQGDLPYFSPARQISGPVAFGALPTGVMAAAADAQSSPNSPSLNAWRTLSFNPNPAVPAGQTHKGLQSPPDYLLLDDFWMPVVEPYAISEPLSTAGKINMNYQIVPFSHITRKTALCAAMKSDLIMAIPQTAAPIYKSAALDAGAVYTSFASNPVSYRFPIDVDHTMELMDYQSSTVNNRLFISPSEICSIFLVPKPGPTYTPNNQTVTYNTSPSLSTTLALNLPSMTGTPATDLATMRAWWQSGNTNTYFTGVNARQQPYAHLYSLLTTKSNTFQVHMRVQLLKKNISGAAAANVYDETTGDRVVGEYRGSAIIERYVDPNDSNLASTDFATKFTTPGTNTLDSYYKYRVTSVTAFER